MVQILVQPGYQGITRVYALSCETPVAFKMSEVYRGEDCPSGRSELQLTKLLLRPLLRDLTSRFKGLGKVYNQDGPAFLQDLTGIGNQHFPDQGQQGPDIHGYSLPSTSYSVPQLEYPG